MDIRLTLDFDSYIVVHTCILQWQRELIHSPGQIFTPERLKAISDEMVKQVHEQLGPNTTDIIQARATEIMAQSLEALKKLLGNAQ